MNLLPATAVVAALLVGVVVICFPPEGPPVPPAPDSCEAQLLACQAAGGSGCFRDFVACVGGGPAPPPGTP